MKSKWLIPLLVVAGAVFLIGSMLAASYNGLVGEREKVNSAWSNVETQYQRRNDLIDNLVSTVKGAADFEKSTLTEVTEARSKVGSVQVNPDNPEDIQKFQEAQGEMSSALSRLIAVSESYPTLTATQNFQDLQAQLEGTENRIQVARSDYNEVARPYNTKVQTFPTNIIAGIFGFATKPYFEADKGAEKAPKVNFGTDNNSSNAGQSSPAQTTTPAAQ